MTPAGAGPGESARVAAVRPAVIPLVRSLIEAQPGTISLGQGVVGYGPPAEVMAELPRLAATPDASLYGPVPGIPDLRRQIATKLARDNGIDLDGAEVMVTAGANLAFCASLLAIADPGDEVVLVRPFYFNYEMAVTMASCVPVVVPAAPDNRLDPDAVGRSIGSRTRAVVTISPNNPTGAVYSRESLAAVSELCRRRGVFHVHDEAYECFVWGSTPHWSPASHPAARAHTISLFSLSKTFGMAGWRVGWAVVPSFLGQTMRKVLDTVQICAPVLSQKLAALALGLGTGAVRPRLDAIDTSRRELLSALAPLAPRCRVGPADGAFYLFLRLDTRLSDLEVVERLVRDHGVAVVPGSAFGVADACTLRVSYGALEQGQAGEAVTRLVTGLRAVLG
ncbi:MAG: aminotransferase class I/II-fold pyridoxal phosphate-dependent enzyme [Thermoanaerobaculaceae bacterium]